MKQEQYEILEDSKSTPTYWQFIKNDWATIMSLIWIGIFALGFLIGVSITSGIALGFGFGTFFTLIFFLILYKRRQDWKRLYK